MSLNESIVEDAEREGGTLNIELPTSVVAKAMPDKLNVEVKKMISASSSRLGLGIRRLGRFGNYFWQTV